MRNAAGTRVWLRHFLGKQVLSHSPKVVTDNWVGTWQGTSVCGVLQDWSAAAVGGNNAGEELSGGV